MKKFLLSLLLVLFISPIMAQSQERFNEKEEESAPIIEEEEAVPSKKPSRSATPKSSQNFWSKTRFGGNFGAGFSNGLTYVNLSPRIYYAATEKWWLGTGVTWIYSQNKYNPPPYDKSTVYGLNLFTTYQVLGPLFVHAEYEPLNFERLSFNPNTGEYSEQRVWVNGLLLGGGISQPMGRGRFFASVLYNVTWRNDFDSYYVSPWVFRIGFGL